MLTRILHVSDLHFGARDDPILERGLASLIEQVGPELVIASGDLTNRGRRDQHERAASFLNRLRPPVLAIPDNHDIPYTFPARFTTTWAEFERHWQTTEPEYVSTDAHVVGLNSVRPWRHQSGGISDEQLERATAKLLRASNEKLRVVVLHHQMVGAPWRTRKNPVARRTHVLAKLLVGEHTRAVELAQHRFEPSTLELRGVGSKSIGVETEPLEALARPVDARSALGKCERTGTEDRTLLDEAPVAGDQRHRDTERE